MIADMQVPRCIFLKKNASPSSILTVIFGGDGAQKQQLSLQAGADKAAGLISAFVARPGLPGPPGIPGPMVRRPLQQTICARRSYAD